MHYACVQPLYHACRYGCGFDERLWFERVESALPPIDSFRAGNPAYFRSFTASRTMLLSHGTQRESLYRALKIRCLTTELERDMPILSSLVGVPLRHPLSNSVFWVESY